MDNANALTTTEGNVAVTPFSFDFGSEFIKENLPAEKRTELAVVAQNVKLDLVRDVAERTIRLQASGANMDQTLAKVAELDRGKGDYVVRSTHHTASGRTEITVRRHSPFIWIAIGIVGLLVVTFLFR